MNTFVIPRRHRMMLAAAVAPMALLAGIGGASAQNLASFAVLAGSAVTNTGSSVITGNVGVSPGSAITGFPPAIVNAPYTIYANNAVSAQVQSELTTAYNLLASRPFTADLSGQDLGGMTLTAGVYNFNTAAQLTGTLTLDAQGDPNAVFIFNIGSTLTTASASSVVLINGADASNVYYRVGSSATLGAGTLFQGNILALTSITLVTGTTVDCGSVLARNGAVTLDTNTITVCTTDATTPVGGLIGDADGDGIPDGSDDDDDNDGIADDVDGDDDNDGVPDGVDNDGGIVSDVADGIDDFVANGGILPIGFQVLTILTPAELAAALLQLGGESATGVAPTAFQAMDQFMNFAQGRRGPGVVSVSSDDLAPGTISVMGYAAEAAPLRAFDEIVNPVADEPEAALWEIWAAVYGGYSMTRGDPANGSRDRTSRNFGFAAGADYRVNPATLVGVTVGAGGTDFGLAEDAGHGRSELFQAALYSRTDFEAAYVSGALGYGLHHITTERNVTFAGFDQFAAIFDAHNVAAEVEAGYRIGLVTPYAAVRAQALFLPAYAETTTAGSSTFALSYAARTAIAARTEVGVKLDWMRTLDTGGSIGLHGQAAWAHYFYANQAVNASFQSLPGSNFSVSGATAPSDSLLVSASAELGLANGLSLTGSLDSELSVNSQSYGGALKVGYSF